MKIPKKLKMFGYDWTVVTNKNKVGGSYNNRAKKIYIGTLGQKGEDVLFHELLEALLVRNFYRFYGGEGSMEYIFHFDHTGMTRIAEQLSQIFKDNDLLK